MADGSIKIKLDIDTKTFENKLSDAKAKIKENLDSTIGDDIIDTMGDGSLENLDKAYEKIVNDIEMLRQAGFTNDNSQLKEELRTRDEILKLMKEQEQISMADKSDVGGTKKIINLKVIEKMLIKYGTALLGVRVAMGLLRKGVSAYMQQNEKMRLQLQGLWNALGEALAPAIEGLLNLLLKGVAIINAFVKALFGVDIVARANAKALANQNKQMKQLASFDEMNKVSDSNGSGVAQLDLPDISDELQSKIQKVADVIEGIYTDYIAPIIEWMKKPLEEKVDDIKNWLVEIGKILGSNEEKLYSLEDILLGIATAVAVAFGLITGNIVSLITGAILLLVYFFKDTDWEALGQDILDGFAWLGKKIMDLFWVLVDTIGIMVRSVIAVFATIPVAVFGFFSGLFDGIMAIIKGEASWSDIGHYIIEGIGNGLSALWEWVGEIWVDFISKVKELFGIHSPSTVFEEIGSFMVQGLANGLSAIWDKVKAIFTTLWANIKNGFTNCWTNIKNGIGSAWDSIITTLKAKLNSIIGWVESMLNKLIDGINSLINKFNGNGLVKGINTILGTNLGFSTVGRVNLPRLAVGGIVNRPTQAIIGEAGREAILPLENNTEWMDILADKIGANGNITIYVQMDGKTISKEIRKANQKYAFATNGGF